MNVLTDEQRQNVTKRGFSRRSFGRIAAMMGAGAAALPFYNEPALAQLSKVDAPPDAVMINANENPLGPCQEAREAVHNMIQYGGRYRYSEADKVVRLLAEQEGLKHGLRAYSSRLQRSAAPGRAGVHLADQTASWWPIPVTRPVRARPDSSAPKSSGCRSTKNYSHDVKAMAAASPDAGLIYICNPNNPTGTLTPQADIEWLVANKPKGSVVMIDEAYTHICRARRSTPTWWLPTRMS